MRLNFNLIYRKMCSRSWQFIVEKRTAKLQPLEMVIAEGCELTLNLRVGGEAKPGEMKGTTERVENDFEYSALYAIFRPKTCKILTSIAIN